MLPLLLHHLLLFLFLFFLPIFSLSLSLDPAAIDDDVLGLIVFKADLRDTNSKLSSWNEDDDTPCNWTGVRCDPRNGRVTDLVLDGLGLHGRVGRGLLQLRSLRRLSLSGNNLSGTFSPDLSRIVSLRSVDLSHNNLSGLLPPAFFARCRSLTDLSLAGNRFSGELPEALASCSSLASLNLSSNRLTGSLPQALWSLNGLRSLDLSGNALTGRIPAGMNKLYNLRSLDLSGNRLAGPLPADVGGCSLLKSLDLAGNSLSGTLPDSLQKLSICGFLTLRGNSFSGEVPSWIGTIISLHTLDLSGNRFSGKLPSSLGKLRALEYLDLSGNNLEGSVPESIVDCRSLRSADFGHNRFNGSLSSWVFSMRLQRLSMAGNKLEGSIPAPPDVNEDLKVLDFSGNSLSGVLPLEINKVRRLNVVDFSRNQLSGAFPASLSELKELEIVDLSQNRFNGSLPSEIGGAVSLKQLVLSKNRISGKIPTQIDNCTLLTSLVLSDNNLSGPLPANIANLTDLKVIDVSNNNLSGTLPKQLSNLGHLSVFNISYNHFSGDLPAGNFFNKIAPSSVSGNPSICGAVVNISCPAVLPKPIVLNPNSSSSPDHSTRSSTGSSNFHQKKIILSISALIAIGAAALIALGVVAITVLNIQVRSSSGSNSAAALVLSDGYYSHSPGGNDGKSGKLVMFTGEQPDFHAGAHAVLSKDCELGRGGFGAVYRTSLRDGRPVAIKKLTVSSLVKSQEDFEKEVKKLGKLRHPNLVTMEGYYWTPSLQLLIYEYVPGGSLYNHLHENPSGSSSTSVLSWQQRFNIVLGMAKSLAHMHGQNIIHYNLKSSNILIGEDGVSAKVGDYGLAKLLPMLDRYVLSSKIQSALGYMAPEFACRTVKITEKCDVYGFGVLALEVVTGRRPVEYLEDDVVVLCDMVRAALEDGSMEDCVDGKIKGNFLVDEAVPVMKLGLICTSQVPSNRPSMAEVVNILEVIKCPPDSQEEELG